MKIFCVFVICLFLSLSLFCQISNDWNTQELETKAMIQFEKFKYDSAAYFYLQVAKKYEKQQNWMKAVNSYQRTANSYFEFYEFDLALKYSQKALELAIKYLDEGDDLDNLLKVNIYFVYGDVFVFQNKYEKGIQYYRKASNIIENMEKIPGLKLADVWCKIGRAYYFSSQYDKADEYNQKSIEKRIKESKDNDLAIAENYVIKGDIITKIKNYDDAILYYQKALSIGIESVSEYHPYIAYIYGCFRQYYRYKGDIVKAIEYHKKVLNVKMNTIGDGHISVVDNHFYMGILCYENLGDIEKGIEYFEKSLSLLRKKHPRMHPFSFFILFHLGFRHKELGNTEKAINYFYEALNANSKLNKDTSLFMADSLSAMGYIHYLKKNYDTALNLFFKRLEYNKIVYGDTYYDVAENYEDIASIYKEKKEYSKAIEYFKKTAQIYVDVLGKHHFAVSDCYQMIGLIHYENKDYYNALKYYQKALIADRRDFNDVNIYNNPDNFIAMSNTGTIETLRYKANTFCQLYKLSNNIKDLYASMECYELLFKQIHELRSSFYSEKTQLIMSEINKNSYIKASNVLWDINEIDSISDKKTTIFELMEKSKASAISVYLYDKNIKQHLNIPSDIIEEERSVKLNRHFYETELEKIKSGKEILDSSLINEYKEKIFYYGRKFDTLIDAIKNKYPEYYTLKYAENYPSIKDIQEHLDGKSVMLSYLIGDTSLFICAINKESYKVESISIDSSFYSKINNYFIDVQYEFSEKEHDVSNYFYKIIIEPVKDLLVNKNKLIIIPDGSLYYLPFETLCSSKKFTEEYSMFDYLIKDYVVTYQHSGSLWLESKRKNRGKTIENASFMGFAPVFDPSVDNNLIISNEWIQDTTEYEMTYRSISKDLKHFNKLEHSEKEVTSIANLFKNHGGNSKVFFHLDANEEKFKKYSKDFAYIHIASHSFTNDKYPTLSGIAFSQPDTTSIIDDGILYTGESYSLNLSNANLVVLSSCKSGLGKLTKGEGFLSLSRGFIYSGVPNIVYSLWNVEDESTKDLMIHFYAKLLEKGNYASAMRNAKLFLLNNPKTAQPKFWGGWILFGE